jgi:hypothetical protein
MTTHASTSFLEGPCFRGGRFVRMPYQHAPDREKSIRRRRRLAATHPLPPAMAGEGKLTFSELAYARVLADDNLIAGDSRDCHDKMAARVGTCSRTIQRAQKRLEKLGWIEVELRPNKGQKHDSNVVRITSPEWLTWIMMGPSPIARQKRRATENQLFSRAIEMLNRRPNAVDKPVWIDPNLKAKLDQLETAVKKGKIGAALVAPRSVLLE